MTSSSTSRVTQLAAAGCHVCRVRRKIGLMCHLVDVVVEAIADNDENPLRTLLIRPRRVDHSSRVISQLAVLLVANSNSWTLDLNDKKFVLIMATLCESPVEHQVGNSIQAGGCPPLWNVPFLHHLLKGRSVNVRRKLVTTQNCHVLLKHSAKPLVARSQMVLLPKDPGVVCQELLELSAFFMVFSNGFSIVIARKELRNSNRIAIRCAAFTT